jgi:hypothetical protein
MHKALFIFGTALAYTAIKTQSLMKKIALLAAFGLSLFAGFRTEAKVNINVQLGAPVVQQPWFASDNDYFYMPNQGVYYNVRRQVYVYPEAGRWNYARRLPARYGNVSYSSVRTVRIHDRSPFDRDNDNRRRYVVVNNDNRRGNDRFDNDRFDNNRRDNNQNSGWNNNDRSGRGGYSRR